MIAEAWDNQTMIPDALERRIVDFARDAAVDDFGSLALAVFERQFEELPAFRESCLALGRSPTSISSWQEIPAVEASRSEALAAQDDPSSTASHPNRPSAEFRQAVIGLALPGLFRPGALGMVIQTRAEIGAQLVEAMAGSAPANSFRSLGQPLDAKQMRSWLGARQRDRAPVSIVAQPEGYARLVGLLERRALKFRLPPGSAAVCVMALTAAGSENGSNKDPGAGTSWRGPLGPKLALPAQSCRSVLCSPEFSTPLVEQQEGRGRRFLLPHWVRARAVYPERLEIFDLAGLGAPAHRLEAPQGPFAIEDGGDERFLVLA